VINEADYVSKTPEECMHRNDWLKWKDVLKAELDSFEKRNIFGSIILTPKNINSVGYKWVFIIKRNDKNEIVRYKARLVAQGFTQISGVDYEETYSRVVDVITFRFLISLIITENLQMRLMDVVTVYLNGSLNNDIYMKFPKQLKMSEAFKSKSREIYSIKLK
jgi:Reverse transcriptase (RNA-dependent DNA polymerase)